MTHNGPTYMSNLTDKKKKKQKKMEAKMEKHCTS